MRDDFNFITKDTLGRRVGMRCSNPDCRKPTSGPQEDSKRSINLGVAAHIRAASPGGKRYDSSQSAAERSGIENGIWLCQNCAKLIDSDELRYSTQVLETWKKTAEEAALQELENRGSGKPYPHELDYYAEADRLAIQKQRLKALYRPQLVIYNTAIQTDSITIIRLQNQGYSTNSLSTMFPQWGKPIEKMFTDKKQLDTDEVLTITLVGNLMRPAVPIQFCVACTSVTGGIYQQEYLKVGPHERITQPALIDSYHKGDHQGS